MKIQDERKQMVHMYRGRRTRSIRALRCRVIHPIICSDGIVEMWRSVDITDPNITLTWHGLTEPPANGIGAPLHRVNKSDGVAMYLLPAATRDATAMETFESGKQTEWMPQFAKKLRAAKKPPR